MVANELTAGQSVVACPDDVGHRRGSAGFRRITLALLASGLATFTSLYCVQALLPELAAAFRLTPTTASLAVSVTTCAVAVGIVPFTALSDVWGRVPAMTAALFVSAVIGLACAFSPNFTVLLVLRIAQGLALAGLQAIAMSYLAEEVHRGSLGFGMGLYVAGNAIGGMAGRLLAGLLVDVAGWRSALGAIGLIALVCSVIFRWAILPSQRFVATPPRPRNLLAAIGRSFIDRRLLRLFLAGLLLTSAFVTIYNFLSFRLLGKEFGLSQAVVGLIFAAYLAGSAGSAIAGRLVDAVGRGRMLCLLAVLILAGIALMVPGALVCVVLGLVIVTAGFFAAHSVASGWVGARSTALRAQGPAVYLLCFYLGSSVGGSLGGIAYDHAGWAGVTIYTAALIAAVLLIARE